MLKIGDLAPSFSLEGNDEKSVSLSDFSGKYIILYFYPKDDTPGCTKQACYFRDDFDVYSKKNAVIIGISKDSVNKHKAFIEKYDLPFILLSDELGKVCEDYGVWKEKLNFGKKYFGIERSTFLIGPDLVILKIFKRVKVEGHSAKILDSF